MGRLGLLLALAAAWACSRQAPAPALAATPAGAVARLIAYECDVDGNLEICTVPAGGGREERLAGHPAEDLYPRFTRDGRALQWSSARSGAFQLWEWRFDARALGRLRSSPAREWQSDPHPDGAQLAFLSDAGGQEALRASRAGGRGVGRLLFAPGRDVVLGNPHWSPDGARLVLSSNHAGSGHHVYLVDAATGDARRVSPLLSGACEPRFSPDGRKLAYVRRQHLTRARSRIVEHDLVSGRERVLVDWPALNYDPTWSPDGSELAFVSDVAGRGVQALYRLRLQDGQSWRVTFRWPARHPDYRPDP